MTQVAGGSDSSSKTRAATSNQTFRVQAAKKRAALKGKKGESEAEAGKGLLGGADYVSLMMGGRRKAREEGRKLHGQTVKG